MSMSVAMVVIRHVVVGVCVSVVVIGVQSGIDPVVTVRPRVVGTRDALADDPGNRVVPHQGTAPDHRVPVGLG